MEVRPNHRLSESAALHASLAAFPSFVIHWKRRRKNGGGGAVAARLSAESETCAEGGVMAKRKKLDDEPMTVHFQMSHDEQRLEAFLRWLIKEAEAKQKKNAAALNQKPAPGE
jgi:hypothetical protein